MNTLSLHGTWNLSIKKENEHCKISTPLKQTIPGDIHSTLLENNIIPDPYYAKNELDIQWVGKTEWIFERQIEIDSNFKTGKQYIVLEGADTFVNVSINGKKIGQCYNQFRLWRFEITDYLIEGKNTIQLEFEPSEKHAIAAANKLAYPVPCTIYPISSPHRNLIRKTQCHAGWDWGPCIMAFGIYDDIRLEQCSIGHIDYIENRTTPNINTTNYKEKEVVASKEWNSECAVTFTSFENSNITIEYTIEGNGLSVTSTKNADITIGENRIVENITVQNPILWWPAGCFPEDDNSIIKTGIPTLKENTLYNLTVTMGDQKVTKKIAFRTIETISENDEHGKSLYFKVNGRSIFSKGSNWIPADALPARATKEKINYLLDTMIKANQNTIRIWGGGRYESDILYELCDKKGLMVWQDCMFACSTYPTNKEFLENVRHEIRHQIRRLQHHPCIVLWCGNNENLGALSWYKETKENLPLYLIDYDRLNEGVVGKEVQNIDPDRTWWPSSPSAGANDYNNNWHADGKGDMHFWSVWHEKKSFDEYLTITPRFVSEFGYESFPSLEEVRSYTPENQLNFTSPVMEFHQRSLGGNSIILENFSRYFRFPEGLNSMLYLSQVQQAIAIKTAVEYWRSLRPICMGSIYWQLNDVWPVASWSSLEYSGRWKLLHYEAKKFFAPLAIALVQKDESNKSIISAQVLNDTRNTVNTEIIISIIDFAGNIIQTKTIKKKLLVDSVSECWSIDKNDLPVKAEECFIYAELKTDKTISTTTLFPALYKECAIRKASITTEVTDALRITLTTDKPAFFVSLETSYPGTFSTNMITLLPGKPVTIQFNAEESLQVYNGTDFIRPPKDSFEKSLRITDLRSTYT